MTEGKVIYHKEDLLWEAVRRNEEYKEYYSNELKRQNLLSIPRDERLTIFPINLRWQMARLPDPSISIEEIKSQIETYKDQGKDPGLFHPFFHIYRDQKRPVIHHHVPGSPYNKISKDTPEKYNLFETENKSIVCIDKHSFIQDPFHEGVSRILISINPTEIDEIIIENIREIKKAASGILRELSEKNKGMKSRLGGSVIVNKDDYYPVHEKEVESHIGWLKKYDDIVSKYLDNRGEKSLFKKKGAVIVPQHFFKELVSYHTKKGTHFYSILRSLRVAYKGAVELIQAAPNIYFHSSKPKSSSKKKS
jgi:hypothetical protein